jgi:hypothetical protein
MGKVSLQRNYRKKKLAFLMIDLLTSLSGVALQTETAKDRTP